MIKLKEIIGYDNLPPYQHWSNSDEELEVAAKSPFTAWEYAFRTGRQNPRLWAVIRGVSI